MASAHEPAIIGSYPRDDVWTRWVDDGLHRSGEARVYAASMSGGGKRGDDWTGRLTLDSLDVIEVDQPVGSTFAVSIAARFDAQTYQRSVQLRVTGDEDDVTQVTIGPGLQVQPGRFGHRRYAGFTFGITAMGAVLIED